MNLKNWIPMLSRLGWSILVLGSLIVLISAIQKKDGSLISRVLVKVRPLPAGEILISEDDVLLIVERTFGHKIEGLPLSSLSMHRLEKAVEEVPFVRNADVFIDAKDQVHIELDQREPVMRVMDNNDLNYYLDENGIRMPISKHMAARVLVATGNLPPYLSDFRSLEDNALADIFRLGLLIREDPFLSAMIEQIHTDNDGKVTLVPKIGDQKIKLGPPEKLEDKLERLKIFYEKVIPQAGWQMYRSVSLEFAGQLVCKK